MDDEIGSYREKAAVHVANAETLLKDGLREHAGYACLELRLAIEAICYGMLLAYRSQLSFDASSKWQPKKVLDELMRIDPRATTDRTLSIQDPVTEDWHVVGGTDHRFSAKWANEAYNSLGNALHTPTPAQIHEKKEQTAEHFEERCRKYLPQLRKVLESKSWNLVLTPSNYKVTCACGFEMRRRIEIIRQERRIECAICDRKYKVVQINEGDEISLELIQCSWTCRRCKTENYIPEHELAENKMIECEKCREPTQLRRKWGAYQKVENDLT